MAVMKVKLPDGTWAEIPAIQGEKGDKGDPGPPGSTATVTAESITSALGYTPANADTVAAFDPTAYNIPVLYLDGDTTGMSKEVAVPLTYTCTDAEGAEHTGSCTLKWQGASSIAYDKKNFTIKLDTEIEMAKGWGAQKKYCLKANFVDHSHARNVVSAKLWGTLVASRSHVNATMAASPNYGAVDGFPYAIMLNGRFQGLYTWNIPKDDWMANMGSGTQEAILCASNATDATAFKALPTYEGTSDMEIEYVTDENDVEWLKTSANRLISLVMASTGYDLDTTIAQYLDWESAIDYYLFTALHAGQDNVTKNYLLLTYDGVKWYFGAYDMDGTYGIKWNGKEFERANSTTTMTLNGMATAHRVFELIKRFKTNALKARWAELRANLLSEGKIDRTFENFVKDIPSRLYFEDVCRWPSIPSTSVSNIDQILRWLHLRLEYVDEMVANLPEQETPVEPEPAMINQVPLSTDTDGTVYNGVGYKDDTRLSSSGSVSGTPQTGSVTTGYIPAVVNDVIRVKGGLLLDIPVTGHYYLGLYDADKAKLSCPTHESMASSDYPQITYSYDASTGVTSITLGRREGITNDWEDRIAYVRMNVYGKGEDLIVTVNQEISE